ncbi:MAG: C40 family peptidase [Cyanobacteria bacterium P01_C01_bin.38]
MSQEELQANVEYKTRADLNIYDSAECKELSTQAEKGRYLRIIPETLNQTAVQVCLCEDDYPGWLSITDLKSLSLATQPLQIKSFSQAQIKQLIPEVIAFTRKAMQQPNYYLWGGTIGPNFDCSGLMQKAFSSVDIRLPRDAYQQEAFLQQVCTVENFDPSSLQEGDLIFFGTPQKATHVGLYLGDNCYIHSSGKDKGRNGIGIDCLSEQGDEVSRSYYKQLRGVGRVVSSYIPQKLARIK